MGQPTQKTSGKRVFFFHYVDVWARVEKQCHFCKKTMQNNLVLLRNPKIEYGQSMDKKNKMWISRGSAVVLEQRMTLQCSYFFLGKKVTARRTTKTQGEKMLLRALLTHTPLFHRAYARVVLDAALELARSRPIST